MNTTPVKGQVASWFGVVFSRTTLVFHGAIVAAITISSIKKESEEPGNSFRKKLPP